MASIATATTTVAAPVGSSSFKVKPEWSHWLADDFVLKFESRWFHPSLAAYINNHHHRVRSRRELDALLTRECPGGVSLSMVSQEFTEMITARLAAACHHDTHAQRLLNSLHGLQLETIIPGWHTFMTSTIDMLRRLLGYRANLDMSYQSSFAIRYVAQPPTVYSPSLPSPSPSLSYPSFLSPSRQPMVQPPQQPLSASSSSSATSSKVVEDPAVVQRHVRGRIESASKKGSLLHFTEPPLGFTLPANYHTVMGHNIHDIVAAVGGEVPHQDKHFYATASSSSSLSSPTVTPSASSSSSDSKSKLSRESATHDTDGDGDHVANHFEHSDECDLTMNISIGDIFEGGQLLLAARSYLASDPPLVRVPEYEATPLSVTPLAAPTTVSGDRVVTSGMVSSYASPRLALPSCYMNHVSYNDMLHVMPLMARQCASELYPSITPVVQESLRHVAQLNYFVVKQRPGRAIFHAGRQVHATMPVISGSRVNIIVMMNALSYFTSWCHLPVTIQVHILKFLTPMTDILAVRATNRANHSLTHDASLWRYLYTSRYGSGVALPSLPSPSSPTPPLAGITDPQTLLLIAQLQAQQAMMLAMQHHHRSSWTAASSVPPSLQASPSPIAQLSQQQQQQLDAFTLATASVASAQCESMYMNRWHVDRHNERMQRYNQLQQARTLRQYSSMPYHHLSRSRQPYHPPARVAPPMPPTYPLYGHPPAANVVAAPAHPAPPGGGYGHFPLPSRQPAPYVGYPPAMGMGLVPPPPHHHHHLSMVRHAQPPPLRMPVYQPPVSKMVPIVPPMRTRPPPMPPMPTFVVNDAPLHDADITPPHCFIQ